MTQTDIPTLVQEHGEGMVEMAAIMTGTTCGSACWHAAELVCRCQCGGKNHGCLKAANGIQPARTSRLDGEMYRLEAVGTRYTTGKEGAADVPGLYAQAEALNNQNPRPATENQIRVYGPDVEGYPYRETERGAPARLKYPSKAQYATWPELAAWKDGGWRERDGITLLWVKVGLDRKEVT